jgi:hypothetical protein
MRCQWKLIPHILADFSDSLIVFMITAYRALIGLKCVEKGRVNWNVTRISGLDICQIILPIFDLMLFEILKITSPPLAQVSFNTNGWRRFATCAISSI